MGDLEKEKRKALSKFLSYVLRYKPEQMGIEFSEKGYCRFESLIEATLRYAHVAEVTEEEICYVLLNSKWQGRYHRFDVWRGYVRAAYTPAGRTVTLNKR